MARVLRLRPLRKEVKESLLPAGRSRLKGKRCVCRSASDTRVSLKAAAMGSMEKPPPRCTRVYWGGKTGFGDTPRGSEGLTCVEECVCVCACVRACACVCVCMCACV
jgi:hypothetical protein